MGQGTDFGSKVVYAGAFILGILCVVAGIAIWINGEREAARINGTYYPGALVFVLPAVGLGLMGWSTRGFSLLRHAKAQKKTIVADDELKIYQDTDSRSAVIARLPYGAEIELGEFKEVDGVDWVIVRLPDGQQGYVIGNAPVLTF